MLPISAPQGFRIIAHRGASAYAPENTMTAFRLAEEMGAEEVEIDVQLTIDGEVVLCHDRDLSRYCHGALVVEEKSWAELAELDMGSWFSPHLYAGERILRLHELFEAYADRLTYHIEIKGEADGLEQIVYDRIRAYGLLDNCFITSFRYGALQAMRAIDDNVRMGWLVPKVDDGVLEGARTLALYQICPRAAEVTLADVAAARDVASEVRAWGLSGTRQEVVALARRVLDAGCDGVTIDWPDWITIQ